MATEMMKAKVLSGLKWNTLSVIVTRSTDFVVNLVLARLLLPDSYGLVGMAMIIIGFLSVFSDMGLFNALVQKREDELTQVRYSSAFWYLLGLASVFVICFFLFLSPLGASFYDEPRLVPVLNALSIYLFFNIISIIPRVILTHRLDFRSLVRITYLGTALSSVTAIVLAFMNFGVWSLVAKSLVGSSTIFLSYWIKVGWRPTFIFKRKTLTELAGYSVFTQINALLFYFRNNLDYIIIGKLVSSHLLGVYTLAFTLSETLRAQLYSIFNKVFFPVYSKIQDDTAQIRYYYLRVMRLAATVTFPISVLFMGLSESIILFFFGHRWIEAAVPLSILSMASMIFSISGTPAEVLKSIGKPSVSFYLNFCNTFFVALPLIYFGQQYFGLAGVGYAVCIHYTISRFSFHYFMKKYIGLTDRDVYNALKRPVLAAALMLATIYLVKLLQLPLAANLFLGGSAGMAVYCLLLKEDIQICLRILKEKNILTGKKMRFLLLRKPSFVYHLGKRTYKLFTPKGKASRLAELNGNQSAREVRFWSDHVLEVKPHPFCLSMRKGIPVVVNSFKKAELFIDSKLKEALTFPTQPIYRAFDFASLKDLEQYGLMPGLLDKAKNILKSVNLPVTSAHGDLHIGNLVYISNEIKIIDWSMFTSQGSFVTDFIHYHNYNYASKNKKSWTTSILEEHAYLTKLAQDFKTTPNHLKLAYSINRISGEVKQMFSIRQIPVKTMEKYNYVLNNIIDELEKAIVQRSDPIVQ